MRSKRILDLGYVKEASSDNYNLKKPYDLQLKIVQKIQNTLIPNYQSNFVNDSWRVL